MKNKAEARIAIVELRSLLVADAHIGLTRKRRLIGRITALAASTDLAGNIEQQLEVLIAGRFGRNPDTFQVSDATLRALLLLDALQSGRSIELCPRAVLIICQEV